MTKEEIIQIHKSDEHLKQHLENTRKYEDFILSKMNTDNDYYLQKKKEFTDDYLKIKEKLMDTTENSSVENTDNTNLDWMTDSAKKESFIREKNEDLFTEYTTEYLPKISKDVTFIDFLKIKHPNIWKLAEEFFIKVDESEKVGYNSLEVHPEQYSILLANLSANFRKLISVQYIFEKKMYLVVWECPTPLEAYRAKIDLERDNHCVNRLFRVGSHRRHTFYTENDEE